MTASVFSAPHCHHHSCRLSSPVRVARHVFHTSSPFFQLRVTRKQYGLLLSEYLACQPRTSFEHELLLFILQLSTQGYHAAEKISVLWSQEKVHSRGVLEGGRSPSFRKILLVESGIEDVYSRGVRLVKQSVGGGRGSQGPVFISVDSFEMK